MEIKEILRQAKKYFWIFIIFPVVGLLAAIIFNLNWKPTFQTTSNIYIAPIVEKEALFNWPIGVQDFSDNLIAALGVDGNLKSSKVQKLGPSFLKVTSSSKLETESQKINEETLGKIKSQIENIDSETGLNFTVINFGQNTSLKYSEYFWIINLVVGALVGVILGSMVFALLIYLKK